MTDRPDDDEVRLPGVIGAVRVGGTIRKPAGRWTPTVHATLRHLPTAGFDLSPSPLGIDERGREILTWIEGDVPSKPWSGPLVRDEGVAIVARTMRRIHDALRGFDPGAEARWRSGDRPLATGEIVCHGDLAPWNTVWQGDQLVGVIDWDMAEPGFPIEDVAFLALHLVPFHADAWACGAGFAEPPARKRRLELLCQAYGDLEPADVVAAASRRIARERDRTVTLGAAGTEPWASFLGLGDLAKVEEDAAWLARHGPELASG